jgi:hypothetical protein
LDINIDFVRLANGDKVALRAVKETSGGGHTGAMTGAMVARSLVFFPAAPFFLFMHGKNITIPKGVPRLPLTLMAKSNSTEISSNPPNRD